MKNHTKVLILAAGKGKRMKSTKPKVLHELAGKSMIMHIIDKCISSGLKDIYIVLGEQKDQILNAIKNIKVKVINQKKQLGTASEHAVQLLEAEKKIKELEDKIYSREAERRKLHNLVQELRGNVRVAVRVRPLLGSGPNEEKDEFGAVKCDKHASFVTLQRSDAKKGDAAFNFDKVFDDTTTNKDVFDDVSDLIQSALDGYNICLFSYGQTGKFLEPYSKNKYIWGVAFLLSNNAKMMDF